METISNRDSLENVEFWGKKEWRMWEGKKDMRLSNRDVEKEKKRNKNAGAAEWA